MRVIWLVLMLLMGLTYDSYAQQAGGGGAVVRDTTVAAPAVRPLPRPIVKRPKPIRTELSGGVRLNTNGWSLFVDKGWVREGEERHSDLFYNLRIAQIEFGEMKHPKEMKQSNEQQGVNSGDRIRPFIYGKVNNFYSLKLGYGFRKMIAGKPEPRTVSVHWFGVGGLSLGLLKPYYVEAYVPQQGGGAQRETIRYTDSTEAAFLDERLLIGAAGFTKGLGEMKFLPGLQLRTGLHFDFSPTKKTVLAVSVGMNAEIYTRKIEIIANQADVPYVFNLFAGFQFGKRW